MEFLAGEKLPGVEALVEDGGRVVDRAADENPEAADVVERERAEPAIGRVHTERVRFGDLDAMRHLNNVVFLRYFETARIAFMRDMFPTHDPAHPEASRSGRVPAGELGDEQGRRHRVHGELLRPGGVRDRLHRTAVVVDAARARGRIPRQVGDETGTR
mgnify:CR=1 FL=1